MASTDALPEPPAQLKAIQGYLRVAADVERSDPVVSYWVRLYSTDLALSIDKESPECKSYLSSMILSLENYKKSHKDNEAISNQTVGQAHVENFIMSLFTKADNLDRAGTANKTTIRMFYMAGLLFESMAVFGPLTDDISEKAKYAKFKAAYILKCLKNGEVPHPGPLDEPGNSDQLPSSEGNTINPSDRSRTDVKPSDDSSSAKPDPFIMTPSFQPYPTPTNPTQESVTNNNPLPLSTNSSSANISAPSPSSTPNVQRTGASTINTTRFHATNGAPLKPEDLIESQKYCKFANSALQYDDIPTAVANLEKALKLLTTGQKSS